MATTSLDHLLPAPDETLRCAEHARRIEVDPGGTAIRAERVVLVATPLPWPKPALDHPALRPLAEALQAEVAVPTRVLAHVPADSGSDRDGLGPADSGSGPPEGETVLVVFDRDGASAVERRYRAADPQQALALVRALASGDLEAARSWLQAEHDPARPTVLICTQGSHDVCCGSEGTRLAAEIEARADATRAPNGGPVPYQVFRVSHTGGHRFAPTAMTLPDGRMWAGLTTALVDQILARTGGPADLAHLAARCRGWWGAEAGLAQVAERAVFAQRGWDLDRHDRQVEVAPLPGGEGAATARATVTVTPVPAGPGSAPAAAIERWEVELAEGRPVPTIACRQPGGLPAKPGREWAVLATRRLGA